MKFAAILAAVAVLAAGPGTAAAFSSRPHAVKPAPVTWQTCQARAIYYAGDLRYDDDLFAGMHGPSCVTLRGGWLTIDSNYRAQPGGVVAYPAIRYGPYFGSGDPRSVLPERVTAITRALTAHVAMRGNSGGEWLYDLDVAFYPTADTSGHWNAEMIIGIRYTSWSVGPGYRRILIGRHWYWAHRGPTCNSSLCWPLIRIRAVTQSAARSLRLGRFIRHLRRMHWISPREWLGSFAFGPECWSACRGLSHTMTVTT